MNQPVRRPSRPTRKGRGPGPFSVILALLVLAACGGEPADRAATPASAEPARAAATPEAAAHARMVATLADIAREVVEENPYFGETGLAAITAQLDRPTLPAVRRAQLLLDKSKSELRLGRTEAALESIDEGLGLLQGLTPGVRAAQEPEYVLRAGITHLRAAEVLNCQGMHNRDSCILPIQGQGIHRDKSESTIARGHFLRTLELAPEGSATWITARWLLNVTEMTLGSYPGGVAAPYLIPPESFGDEGLLPRFPNIANEVGLATRNLSGGVVIEDLDGDGDLDILTSTWDPTGNLHYFRNEGEEGFQDRTDEANLRGILGGLNMIHADYDGDGDCDVVVLRGAWLKNLGKQPNSLLRNDGRGRFTDVAYLAGIAGEDWPTQAGAFADYDNDGDLDLYFGNESTPELPAPSQLFRNDGQGRFTDVATEAGVLNMRYAKGVAWGDVDEDGDLDLYVSNLAEDNRLYLNDGQGRFTDSAAKFGVTEPRLSFPCWFFDYDNDGHLDLYCAAYDQEIVPNAMAYIEGRSKVHGRLYRGHGDGRFEDVSEAAGLDRLATTMGANFGDLDNDGFLDFYLGTGWPAFEGLFPNVMYRNVGGERFVDVTRSGGFGHLQKGHGVAFADLDGDGDQDVFEQLGGAFPGDSFMDALFRNPGNDRHWLGLKLVGRGGNASAIGARVTVVTVANDAERRVHRQVGPRGSFGSSPLQLHVGLGEAIRIPRVEILWPGTKEPQVVKGFEPDRIYRLEQGNPKPAPIAPAPAPF